jgi:hypothetical protein
MEQFEIYNLISFTYNLTNVNYGLLLVVIIIMSLSLLQNNQIITSYWGILTESLYKTL